MRVSDEVRDAQVQVKCPNCATVFGLNSIDNDRWHYHVDGYVTSKTVGPVGLTDIEEAIRDGTIRKTTLVLGSGTKGQWLPLDETNLAHTYASVSEAVASEKQDAQDQRALERLAAVERRAAKRQKKLEHRESRKRAAEERGKERAAAAAARRFDSCSQCGRSIPAELGEFPVCPECKATTQDDEADSTVDGSQPKIRLKHWMAFSTAAVIIVAAALPFLRGGKPSVNPLQSLGNSHLQNALQDSIDSDYRNAGIDVSAYYKHTFDRSVIVFDLHDVSGDTSRIDVFRLFLDFADKLQLESFEWVELAFRGDTRFKITGNYFETLGSERDDQNPMYTVRTFPENLLTPEGLGAFPEWTGGMLGVLEAQIVDFNEFHNRWYWDEVTTGY